ncbi:hypothetical protein EI77_02559 [Prosthecobacter fusiformis]|uniref:Type IV secretion system protein VirB5 n=1 Tax=Prosthecobacter fusiformis TaxID=48464 RepID=A0A4R7S2F1_9BACT|nr:hypothetical protein [Prosthecobacter fusiformis]TDU71435.1 hypothetical protein EI77_02559 [Prosthecobacter fusiformis]
MKTPALILAGVLISSGAFAQGASTVIVSSAPSLEMSQSELSAKLTQILNEAQLQNEKLQTSLDRIGDPAAANLASVQMIKQDIIDSASALKTEAEQREAMSALTGAEVFTEDAFGLKAPIGDTITRKDGVVVDRDPELYRMESAMMSQIREFKSVRENALQRKVELTAEMSEVIQDLEDAQDLASIQKLNAMLTVLRGQIDECNQTILIAQADADMMQKELVGQAQIFAKGKQEEAQNVNQTGDPDAPPATPGNNAPTPFGGVAPGGTARPLIPNLTWGRRDTPENTEAQDPEAPAGEAN